MDSTDEAYLEFLSRLSARSRFVFSRWGLPHWQAALGRVVGHTPDGQPFSPGLSRELRRVLFRSPEYELGITAEALEQLKPQIDGLLERGSHHLSFADGDVWRKQAAKGNLELLIGELRERNLLLLGPPHLGETRRILFPAAGVVPAPRDAFANLAEIEDDAVAAIVSAGDRGVLSVSLGPASAVLIDRLSRIPGIDDWTIVDFGSIWDPFAGVHSREPLTASCDPAATPPIAPASRAAAALESNGPASAST